jgi:fructoselysine-6-P-deglycase FrlB-like protein
MRRSAETLSKATRVLCCMSEDSTEVLKTRLLRSYKARAARMTMAKTETATRISIRV